VERIIQKESVHGYEYSHNELKHDVERALEWDPWS